MRLYRQKITGFTYVEMVFTVAMLAILAVMAVPYLEKNVQRKKEVELKQNLREIRRAIDAYKEAYDAGKINKLIGESGYPKTLEDLTTGVENIADPQKRKLFFLRRIPADPMFHNDTSKDPQNLTPADTWGKRSYASDADNPREGRDVFDVYSMNPAVGLNGIPYGQW